MRQRWSLYRMVSVLLFLLLLLLQCCSKIVQVFAQEDTTRHKPEPSVANVWNQALLRAIRRDLARPPVHARNLFHLSAAMWDAWAAYHPETALPWLHNETAKTMLANTTSTSNTTTSTSHNNNNNHPVHETISYAAYSLLLHRFRSSRAFQLIALDIQRLMNRLGYTIANNATTTTEGDSAAALGNRIAQSYIQYGLSDGSNEASNFVGTNYFTINPQLDPTKRGNLGLYDPNRWQGLYLQTFVDQSGNTIQTGVPSFQSPEWGRVTPFSLDTLDRKVYTRDQRYDFWVYHDPGPPPLLSSNNDTTTDLYKRGFEQVLLWSGLLDPHIGDQRMDISPASRGNNSLGTNDGRGYTLNPSTQTPYLPQRIPAGDYYRVLAEFWADGPDSETPPGHWFTIANEVSYHDLCTRQIQGNGPVLEHLEWDVKLYLALGGALHDAAIAAWSTKGWYDYIRPISALRYMAGRGQCSDPNLPSYHPHGIHLYPGAIELITVESSKPGERHAHLNETIGKIAAKAWRGPEFIHDPNTDTAGVGWMLVEDWWPYQRPSFVTPPFAGFVSGHSTFSRAAARVLTEMTGDAFFPGGLGEFLAPQNDFLVFEDGPSVNVTLQWATYFDAADECSLSRIYGGIHPTADDIPGRIMGDRVGRDAVQKALRYFAWPRTTTTTAPATTPSTTSTIVPTTAPLPRQPSSWSESQVYVYLGKESDWSREMVPMP